MKILYVKIWGILWMISLAGATKSKTPELIIHDDGTESGELSTTIQNDLISMDIGSQFGTKLIFRNTDLVGNASGAYASYDGNLNNLTYTSVSITDENNTTGKLDVAYHADEGSVHFVLFPGLPGFYSYFVNRNLGKQGAFRTLYRLSPDYFTHGRTYLKDTPLPPLAEIQASTKIQDETWERSDGSYITKYDYSFFIRNSDHFWGVHSDSVGAWMVTPGELDYYNGDHLKQELTVHRESTTGDAVLLNVLHGTHYQAAFSNLIPVGKLFGPWLVYFNNGSVEDAAARARYEEKRWPYNWLEDSNYHSRGIVAGRLRLDSGDPAAGAAVFLGDDGTTISQGTTWQYTTYANAHGEFEFKNVRTEKSWTVQAWGVPGVTTAYKSAYNFTLRKGQRKDLGTLTWKTQPRLGKSLWRIGDFDRKATGFKFGGSPYLHGRVDDCPANLTYVVGSSSPSQQWCFGKSAKGTWSVVFEITDLPLNGSAAAVLSVSLAGYSGSSAKIGGVGSTLEIYINGVNLGNHATGVANDPSLYRSGTTAGEWRYFEWSIQSGVLKAGKNTVDFTTNVTATRWKGVMWDALMLEWA